jgi:hypothetical protein
MNAATAGAGIESPPFIQRSLAADFDRRYTPSQPLAAIAQAIYYTSFIDLMCCAITGAKNLIVHAITA